MSLGSRAMHVGGRVTRVGRSVRLGTILLLLLSCQVEARQQPIDLDVAVLEAAQQGDRMAVEDLLNRGASVDAANVWGVTPLISAADKANLELVRVLLDRGADPNAKDLRYGTTPITVAVRSWGAIAETGQEVRRQIVEHLLAAGASGGPSLSALVTAGHVDLVTSAVQRGGIEPIFLNNALATAKRARQQEIVELLVEAGARDPGPQDSPGSPEWFNLIAGVYESEGGTLITLTADLEDDVLLLERSGQEPVALLPLDATTLRSLSMHVVATVTMTSGVEVVLHEAGRTERFARVSD